MRPDEDGKGIDYPRIWSHGIAYLAVETTCRLQGQLCDDGEAFHDIVRSGHGKGYH